MSSDDEDDSLLISNDTTSEDISLIHLAETSMSPIIFPAPALGVVTLIDLIESGVPKDIGSVGAVDDQDVPL